MLNRHGVVASVGDKVKMCSVAACSAIALSAAAAPPPGPPGVPDSPVRVICQIRAGSEGAVRATLRSMSLGGENIVASAHAAHCASLAATFTNIKVVAADSPLTWEQVDQCAAAHARLGGFIVVEAAHGTSLQSLIAGLAAHADHFVSVEADAPGSVLGGEAPNDPYFALQYGLNNTGAPVGGSPGVPHADIAAINAWALAGGAPVTIAILDTGVSRSHPDLAPKLVPGYSFVGTDPTATDDSSFLPHGTACAGIAAASGNDAIGISGVSWHARIMPVRVADQWGNSTETLCANGIIWAVDHGARVISISLGFSAGTTYLAAAVSYANASGAVVVAAAGNTPGAPIFFPARWSSVLAVSATDNRDIIGPFCTTGPEVDVCAPGVSILTTTDSTAQPDTYRYETGTSMAAPFVSGVAALLLQTAPWLSPAEIRRLIKETADDRGPAGWDPQYGHGRVNAASALQSLSGDDQVCLADWNADGVVTSADFFAYLNSFFAGVADVNGDGQTTPPDLFEFIARYSAGC